MILMSFLALSAALGLFFNGGQFPRLDTLRDAVEEHVADKARQRKALAALDVAQVHIKSAREQQAELAAELATTLARPDLSNEELAQVLARVDAIEADALDTFVDVRRRLADSTTPAEWALLFPPPAAQTN